MRDADGWWVPSPGTKSRLIYGLLKHGLSTSEIADELSLDCNSVCWRIASAARVFGIEQAGRKAIPTTSACAPTTASSACSTD